MRTIAILLCDNDFGTTFTNLLETVKRIWEFNSGKISCDEMEMVIKLNMMPHYRSFQNIHCFSSEYPDFVRVSEYLNRKVRILFDAEAEKAIATLDHDSGSWYLELQSGVIDSF